MKEIISKRNKKPYIFVLILTVITIALFSVYSKIPSMRTICTVFLCALVLALAEWIFFLADPRGVIERHGDKLLIRRGLFKTVVNISDIKEVFLTPNQVKKGGFQRNSVTVKALVGNKEKSLVCGDVIDAKGVVEKINALL